MHGERLTEACHRLEELPAPEQRIIHGRRKARIALAQLRDEACKLGKPEVTEEIIRSILLF